MKPVLFAVSAAIFVLFAGCVTSPTIRASGKKIDLSEKTATLLPGASELLTAIKEGLIEEGWELTVIPSESVEIERADEYNVGRY